MNIKIEVHKNNQTERRISNLPSWNVPDSTKKEMEDFIAKARIGQVQEGKRLSERTLSKYLSLLKTNLEIINKQTSKITKKDIEVLDRAIAEKKSASDYRRAIQVFLKWKLGLDKAKEVSGWLDTKDKTKTPDYLSEAQINSLYKACKSSRERFLIAVLFDSGARIEEFLNVRFEDIQLPEGDDNFIKITFKEEYSKTKGRVISLYWKKSLEAVRDFLEEREKESHKITDPVYDLPYDATRFFLYRLGDKVLKKKINPHLFRHSSATYYATKLNRQELCYRYGWAFSSNMPDVYISRSGMESKHLDEKFKSTELEDVQKKFELEKFKSQKEMNQLKQFIEMQSKLNQAILQQLKGKDFSKDDVKDLVHLANKTTNMLD